MKNESKILTREAWAKRVGSLPPGEVLPEVPPLFKFFNADVEVKDAVDPVTGMNDITFVISTSAVDRDHDIIEVGGWNLENYLKNPVVLYGHNYRGLPVARAVEVGVKGENLIATDRFTPADVHPFGYMVYQLVRSQFLSAVSVGFRPTAYVYNDDHGGYDFKEQELLEHSVVPVPSNPEALALASAKGIDISPMIEWAEMILDDPDSDRVALWLPRETLEAVRKAAGAIAPTQIETSIPGDTDPPAKDTEEPAPGTEPEKPKLTDDEEALMKESIKALTKVVSDLQEALEKLPDAIAGKITEAIAEKTDAADAPETTETDSLTEDDAKAIVKAAIEEVILSTTGKLPE